MASYPNGFIPIASLGELEDGQKICLEVDDRFVVLIRIGQQVFCLDDICTHDGGPLGEGDLDDYCLVCPRHGAKFDIRTGEAVSMPATEPTIAHEVKIEGEKIFVRLNEK